MSYNNTEAKRCAPEYGLEYNDHLFKFAEIYFKAARLTQDQVDTLVHCHCDITAYLFTPQNYTLMQRIGIAYHFLFGKPIKPKANHYGSEQSTGESTEPST